jgi:hypothetical protein
VGNGSIHTIYSTNATALYLLDGIPFRLSMTRVNIRHTYIKQTHAHIVPSNNLSHYVTLITEFSTTFNNETPRRRRSPKAISVVSCIDKLTLSAASIVKCPVPHAGGVRERERDGCVWMAERAQSLNSAAKLR